MLQKKAFKAFFVFQRENKVNLIRQEINVMSARVIKEYRRLSKRKYRQKDRCVVLEGFYLLEEAVKAGLKLEAVLYTHRFLQMKGAEALLKKAGADSSVQVEEKIFDEISQTETPQGVGAIAYLPEGDDSFFNDRDCFFLILDGLQDPGNMGTIVRTAAAAGVSGMLLMPGTVDPFNPKAIRASMGGIFYLPVLMEGVDSWLEVAAEKNIQLIAAHVLGDKLYHEVNYTLPCGVIIGNESKGVSPFLLARAAVKASIPLAGMIPSLNAAVAASVFIFEAIRQNQIKK